MLKKEPGISCLYELEKVNKASTRHMNILLSKVSVGAVVVWEYEFKRLSFLCVDYENSLSSTHLYYELYTVNPLLDEQDMSV